MANGPSERRVSRVDYDAIASGYDRRYRDGGPADLAAFVRARCREALGGRVLEVGCGSGRWLAEAGTTGARPVGLDPSAGMLARAREQAPSAALVRGRAEALPFAAASCGAVLCIYVVHHLDDAARFVAEAARVLAPGGTLSVLALAPHDGVDRWYVYDYFDSARETDVERYPATAVIAGWMTSAGLANVSTEVAAHITATAHGEAVLDDPILTRHGTCQLSLLEDAAFERGMARIRADAARAAPPSFVTDLRIFATLGVKPA
jgi:ubiquinone/menaquinone biosynthesis C-methylase UbiE